MTIFIFKKIKAIILICIIKWFKIFEYSHCKLHEIWIFLMILLRESWHQIERVSISNENFEVVNSVLTSITIQCFGDGFKCLKYFSTIGKTFYIFEHFLIIECFTKFFSWIHKLKVIFFSHGHKLGIKLTIVIRNGKIV